ncbi:MAG: filamentous hemagglutinin N-terminal domain-containing protein [Calothrix sp. MO_192.B10]|nr:filamentous hemagglutinin N-terminal domain-containing protein [Calothrix sp. MO_192.B10]
MDANWQFLNQKLWLSVPLITSGLFMYFGNTTIAQVTPDKTLGKESSVVTPVNSNTNRIDGGAIRGSNLFHSFKNFNVGEGRRVDFANPAGIENILSRVTGSNASNILGTLGVLGNANLYLLNPNGIIFGQNAQLDIRGSFVASTGKGVTFEDRILYGANNPGSKPLLTMAVPVGLQYGTQQGGNINNAGNLKVGQGKKLALVGNTVTTSGQLIAPGGTVQVLGSRVGLVDNARIDVSGDMGGGNVLIGGDFQGKGEVPNAKRTFVASGVSINADALTSGDGGRVIVWGDEITGFYGNISARGGSLFGNGGFAEVSGKENLIFRGNVDLGTINGDLGTLLLDPTNITIVGGGNNPSELAANNEFTDSGINNTISNDTINAATANVILQATNDITFDAEVDITANGVGLTAEANNNINVNANITSNGGNITLLADKDNSGAGALVIKNAEINTNGGNFVGSGKGSDANPLYTSGVNLTNGGRINAAGGNIELTGVGRDGGINGKGINVERESGIETTGTGNITLTGTSGKGKCDAGECRNHGISIGNPPENIGDPDKRVQVKTENGKITFIGKGALSDGDANHGIAIWNVGWVESTGTGAIEMTGTTEAETSNNVFGNDGISIAGGGIVKSATGDITMTGTGSTKDGGKTDGNQGIVVLDPNSKVTSENGNILLTGTGRGSGDNHYGIWIGRGNGGEVTSTNGNITLIGKGGGTGKNNIGILLDGSGLVKTDGTGNITLDGTSGTGNCIGNCENHGILIANGSKVISENGNISFIGKGASSNGNLNHGIYIITGSLVQSTGTGSIEMTGTTEATTGNSISEDYPGNDGISITGNESQVISNTGNITMTGTGGKGEERAEKNGNQGIALLGLKAKITSENGDISLTGTGRGIGNNHYGIWIGEKEGKGASENQGSVTSVNGNITLIGKGGGTGKNNIGVFLSEGGLVSTAGTGKIVLNGTGGNGTDDNHGILIQGNSQVSSINGEINLFGRGGDNTTGGSNNNVFNRGVVRTNGTGKIVLNGTAGNENSKNVGIKIQDFGSQIFSSRGGDINLAAKSIFLTDDGQVRTSITDATDAVKKGGNISVNASDTLELSNGGRLRAQTSGTGNAGNITIDTNKLHIEYNQSGTPKTTGIGTDTRLDSNGNGGNLTINAAESVTIKGNKSTSFNPSPTEENVREAASTSVGLTASTLGSGKAGNLTITTKRLTITNGSGAATASLFREGDGGVLKVTATESIELQNLAGLATATIGSGNAGNLIVDAGQITLKDGAVFSADTFRSGQGGDLIIKTNELNILSGSRVGAATVGGGQGGTVKVNTPENKAQLVQIDGVSANGEARSGIFSDSRASGNAGNIEIFADTLDVKNSGEVSVSSFSSGFSGDLNINAGSIFLSNQARLNASTEFNKGGDINIEVAGSIVMRNNGDPNNATEISSTAFGDADGGDITFSKVGGIILGYISENSDVVATAEKGQGGEVNAESASGRIFGFRDFNQVRTPESDFSADALQGQDGVVRGEQGDVPPQIPQQPRVRDIPQVCPATQGITTRAVGKSQFTNVGRGGLPPNPGEVLNSNTPQVPWVTLDSNEKNSATVTNSTPSNTASKPQVIKEAQGWVALPNGKVRLTAHTSTSTSTSCVFGSSQQ